MTDLDKQAFGLACRIVMHPDFVSIQPDGSPLLDVLAIEHLIADALRAYGEACAAAERECIVAGLHNAALLVRRDGGSEERVKAFEDAAFIANANARLAATRNQG